MLYQTAQYLKHSRHKVFEIFCDLKPTLKLEFSMYLGKIILLFSNYTIQIFKSHTCCAKGVERWRVLRMTTIKSAHVRQRKTSTI